MAEKSIKMRKKNGDVWDVLYPYTLATNVMFEGGKSVQEEHNNLLNKVATNSKNGMMTSADKVKLDGIAVNANNYVHPDNASLRHVTDVNKANWNDKYTKAEVDTKVANINSSITAIEGDVEILKVLRQDVNDLMLLKEEVLSLKEQIIALKG